MPTKALTIGQVSAVTQIQIMDLLDLISSGRIDPPDQDEDGNFEFRPELIQELIDLYDELQEEEEGDAADDGGC